MNSAANDRCFRHVADHRADDDWPDRAAAKTLHRSLRSRGGPCGIASQPSTLPDWLQTRPVSSPAAVAGFARTVDAGEAEAIALAKEIHADRLLIDERKGRRLAQAEGLHVIGLLGVVLLAKRKGFISDARHLIEQLVNEAGVYLDPDLINSALQTVGE